MKIFGLLSLLVVIGVGVWWVSSDSAPQAPGQSDATSYQDAIDAAHDAVGSISSKKIKVHDGIEVSEGVTSLDLSGRGLEGSLKAEIRHLTRLQELNLSNNNFTGLPAEVGQLSQLEVLNLSNNPLTGLPYELGNLQNLQTLDLRGTQYSEYDLNIINQQLPVNVLIHVDG
jgi:hypothetical protein